MSSIESGLEEQLLEAGNRLLVRPLPSVDELLPLLEQVENYLQRVEQSPSKSMQNALSPSMKALVKEEFLQHSDVDVKVAVASCISEITRITAPDAPYDDDQMKDVFRLIVSSFENLSDKSSRSYIRRAMILETVAKVRSCVIMLDLECDGLIIEMFQHFLKAIRDYHSENIFTSMETIMRLVLEESEDISLELLTPILDSMKKGNKDVLPIAQRLGEKVLKNCAGKLKPYLTQSVNSLGVSLDDYSEVVSSICDGTADVNKCNDDNASGHQLANESKLAKAASDEAAQSDENKLASTSDEGAQVAQKSVTEEACPENVDTAADKSPKSVVDNGITVCGKEGTLMDPGSSDIPHTGNIAKESINVNETDKVETDGLDAGRPAKFGAKSEQASKKRGNPFDSSCLDSDGEAEKLTDQEKNQSADVQGSPVKDPSAVAAQLSEDEKETNIEPSSPKMSECKTVNVAPPSPTGSHPDESCPKKVGRRKKKESSTQEEAQSTDDVSKMASGKLSDLDLKPQKRSGKKQSTNEDKIPATVVMSKNEGETTSESEVKPLKNSGKKADASNNIGGDKSSLKKNEEGKRRGRGTEKDATKSSAKADAKEKVSSPRSTTKSSKDEAVLKGTPKMDSKRKRTPGNDKVHETREHGQDLVGLKVKVWWPKDRAFYEGVVEFFDPVKKKHKVSYTDGDEEILNLEKERWEIVVGDSGSHEEPEDPIPDTSEMHKRKKTKTNSEQSAKREKMEVSLKWGGASSSGKVRGTAAKSVRKSNDDGRFDSKSKDNSSKSGGKSEDDAYNKSKGNSQKSGSKSVDDTSRAGGRSKDIDSGTPKTPAKLKQDTPKIAIRSKSKTSQTGKSSANGTGKVKSSSSKVKETHNVKEKSPDSSKKPESVKGKSTEISKVQESDTKGGKKRKKRS